MRLLQKFENELAGFNKYERPVKNDNDNLKVELGLTLQQIIDVVSSLLPFILFYPHSEFCISLFILASWLLANKPTFAN